MRPSSPPPTPARPDSSAGPWKNFPAFRIPGQGWHHLPVLAACRSWRVPHQVDERKNANPDNVQGVPEQAETGEPAQYVLAESLRPDLRHHRAQPQHPDRHMQSMASDQSEEAGVIGALGGAHMLRHQAGKLLHLQKKKAGAESTRQQKE